MLSLEKRVENLEKYLFAHINRTDIDKSYADDDTAGLRQVDSFNAENIASNTTDISDSRTAIEETYELGLDNSNDLSDLRTAVEEVYELMEGGENNG